MIKPNIICFYWNGDRWRNDGELNSPHLKRSGYVDNDLASLYVNNLFEGCKRFTTIPFNFICFTNENLDLDTAIEKREFPVIGSGVLPRLYMFSKDSGLFGNQNLCLDIDVVITGNLKKMLDYRGIFCTRSRFPRGEEHLLDGDVMSFWGCQENDARFWTPFKYRAEEVEEITGGRERFWISHVTGDIADRWDEIMPGAVISYKKHVRGKGIPEKAKIISFHGYPRPHQAKEPWMENYWTQ